MTGKLKFLSAGLAMTLTVSALPVWADGTAADSSDAAAFEQTADRFYRGIIGLSPANLHFYQSSTDNLPITLTNPLGSFSEEQTELKALLQEISDDLSSIDFHALDSHQRQVYLAMQDCIQSNNAMIDLPDYVSTLGPMGGILSSVDTIITEYYLLSESDVQNYIDLLNDVPRFLNDVLAEISYQEKLGYAPSAYAYENVLEKRDDMTSLDEHPYLNAFISNLEECSLPEETASAYTSEVVSVLTDTVIPAYSSFFDTLEKKSQTAEESRGLCSYNQGKDYYAVLARINTGCDMTPDELMQYLDNKIAEDVGRMSRIFYTNPFAMDQVESIAIPWTTTEEMLQALKQKALEIFPAIDNTDYILSYLPESLEVENNLAYYVSPPSDLLTRNVIRVNGSEVGDDLTTLWTTLSHEGFPGHLYQTQYYMQNVYRYPIENLIGSLGTSEGWAFYAERLALDWAGLDPDIADVYWYNTTINMGITAMIDLGVNYDGWSAADISSYLSGYFGEIDKDTAQDLFDTAANDPGIYLPYAIGYYQISDLFDQIKANYSSDTAMYTAFLNHSNLPFTLLGKYLGSDGSI